MSFDLEELNLLGLERKRASATNPDRPRLDGDFLSRPPARLVLVGSANHLLGQQRRPLADLLSRAAVLFPRCAWAGGLHQRRSAWIHATTWARSSTSTKPTQNLRPLTMDSRTAFRMAGPAPIRWVPLTTIINSPTRRTWTPRCLLPGNRKLVYPWVAAEWVQDQLRDHTQSRSDRKDRGLFTGLAVSRGWGLRATRPGRSASRHARRRPASTADLSTRNH